jgi:hypothetical protein
MGELVGKCASVRSQRIGAHPDFRNWSRVEMSGFGMNSHSPWASV